jgi:hypothetical protein
MPTADGQLFTDEFIGEVIGIARLRRLDIQQDPDSVSDDRCGVFVVFDRIPGRAPEEQATFTGKGRTMGFALANARHAIKERWGR